MLLNFMTYSATERPLPQTQQRLGTWLCCWYSQTGQGEEAEWGQRYFGDRGQVF